MKFEAKEDLIYVKVDNEMKPTLKVVGPGHFRNGLATEIAGVLNQHYKDHK